MSGSEYSNETSDSEASVEPEEKPKSTKKRTAGAAESVAKNYYCVACGGGFKTLGSIHHHQRKCKEHLKKSNELTCHWCNTTFSNRGVLTKHAIHVHNDSSYRTVIRVPTTKKRTAGAAESVAKNYYYCVACGGGFKTLGSIQYHQRKCEKHLEKSKELTCHWCNMTFSHRGVLTQHAVNLHNDSSYRAVKVVPQPEVLCHICNQGFRTRKLQIFHIRSVHFNLKGKAPYAELKKVNQVWFENVMNSNNIIEIRKTGLNRLVMKKIDENSAIKVNNDNERIIDVSHIYPTNEERNHIKIKCKYCPNVYTKNSYKRHVQTVHMNITKHICNNCHRSFKESYKFIKHVCKRVFNISGVRRGNSTVQISKVESLSVPSIDKS